MNDSDGFSQEKPMRQGKALDVADENEALLHELQVHQLELEMQNKELRETQGELEESRDRFADLYDFSPVGYVTLSKAGLIHEINLTAAKMLACERPQLLNYPFTSHLDKTQRRLFLHHLNETFSAEGSPSCQLSLRGKSGNTIHVALESKTYSVTHDDEPTCRTVIVDVSAKVNAERSLHQQREEEEAILKAVPIGVGLVRDRVLAWNNEKLTVILGYSSAELLGKSSRMLYESEQEYRRVGQEKYKQIKLTGTGSVETHWVRSDGKVLDIYLSSTAIDRHDLSIGVVFTAQDITQRKLLESKAKLAQQVIENTGEGVMITDPKGVMVSVNPAFEKATGYSASEALGNTAGLLKSGHQDEAFYQHMWNSISRTGNWAGEIWNRRKNGEIFPEWLTISAITNDEGKTINYVGVFSDVTNQLQVKERLHRLAYYDILTGLPNRTLFTNRLKVAQVHALREHQMMALMFLDLDGFKDINDTLGHGVGDQLLKMVAERLKHGVRKVDTIARLGGDEFSIILPGINTPDIAARVAAKILALLNNPFSLNGQEYFITASIGISLFPDAENGKGDGESQLKHADAAMYQAKRQGRNGYQFYTAELSTNTALRLGIENDLRRALEREEFCIHYQPQMCARSGRIIGMEALLRWQRPDGQMVMPNQFIPVLEDTRLIIPVTEWLVEKACLWLSQLSKNTTHPLKLSVNVSTYQFQKYDLPGLIDRVMDSTESTNNTLELEITESALINDNQQVLQILKQLQERGVRIALDDFGTGYSSLGYLQSFPIDLVKIDRSFIQNITHNTPSMDLVHAIIAMCRIFNIDSIAEGVETTAQLGLLHELGVDSYQGYIFSRPLPENEFIKYLQTRESLFSKDR